LETDDDIKLEGDIDLVWQKLNQIL
jgi:hypothetical protein